MLFELDCGRPADKLPMMGAPVILDAPFDDGIIRRFSDGDCVMTPIEHNHSESGARRLRFDRYVLDLERGCLLLDDSEIVLRPKTLAVLRFLVDNPGRLVSKEDLFAAVWPNIAVTDDVLVQSVGELRRALANDGQRLIKTIPRRGYRFESIVSAESSANPTPVGDGTATASMDDGILAFRMPNAQKALISIFRGDWRRAWARGSDFCDSPPDRSLWPGSGCGYPIAEN